MIQICFYELKETLTNLFSEAVPGRLRNSARFTNIRHFTDDGYTGTNFNRPGFKAMMAEVEAGNVGTIIVNDNCRFGRD